VACQAVLRRVGGPDDAGDADDEEPPPTPGARWATTRTGWPARRDADPDDSGRRAPGRE
jgi:hypothetical protein